MPNGRVNGEKEKEEKRRKKNLTTTVSKKKTTVPCMNRIDVVLKKVLFRLLLR